MHYTNHYTRFLGAIQVVWRDSKIWKPHCILLMPFLHAEENVPHQQLQTHRRASSWSPHTKAWAFNKNINWLRDLTWRSYTWAYEWCRSGVLWINLVTQGISTRGRFRFTPPSKKSVILIVLGTLIPAFYCCERTKGWIKTGEVKMRAGKTFSYTLPWQILLCGHVKIWNALVDLSGDDGKNPGTKIWLRVTDLIIQSCRSSTVIHKLFSQRVSVFNDTIKITKDTDIIVRNLDKNWAGICEDHSASVGENT